MKINYFNSDEEYEVDKENIKSTENINNVDFVINNNTICVDLMTDCKRPKTAVKRLFKAINNSKYNELFDGWEETIIESIENGFLKGYEENEYAWEVVDYDGEIYIFIKFFNYEITSNSEVINHTTKEEKMVKELNMAVCEGHHDIPQATDGAIYKNEISKRMLLDIQMLEGTALHKLWEVCYKKGYTDSKTDEIVAGVKLNLYVTGLTVAVISAIKAAKFEGMKVTLWHYNRDNNNYYPQEI